MGRRDQDRCQELYDEYIGLMYCYVKKRYRNLPEEDIHDILQEVWTALLNQKEKVYGKGDEGQFAWLIKVTRSKVADYYRDKSRTAALGEKVGRVLQEQQFDSSVQDTVIRKLAAMELIEGLTEEERKVFCTEYFSENEEEFSNAFKCKRSRLRRKIEEGLGVMKKKRR